MEEEEVSLYFTSPKGVGEVRVYYVSSPMVAFFVATLKEKGFEQVWGTDSFSPQAALNQAAMTWDVARPSSQGNPFKGALAELMELEGSPPQLISL